MKEKFNSESSSEERGEFEREDMPNTALFPSVILLLFAWRSELMTSQLKPLNVIFAGSPLCYSSNGGRIFNVFAALFLRNNVVKFEKLTLILIV